MKKSEATYVFPGANTARGYRSFFKEGLKGLEQVFILKGGPGCGKSTLIRGLGNELREQGFDVEFWQCSADADSLDGVVRPELKAAVIDGTAPHTVDPVYPGAVEEIVDLGACWDGAELRRQKEEIVGLGKRISRRYALCYADLAEAGALVQRSRDNVAERGGDSGEVIGLVFGGGSKSCRHLFASSVTPRGWVSLVEPLSRRARRRIILIGPFGGGKESLMADVAAAAEQRHIYAELYHHPLAVEELQLIWLPDLETAVIAAEEALPHREGDVVIECGRIADTSRAEAERARIGELTNEGGRYIAEAKTLHDELENCYRRAMDYGRVDEIKADLLTRLLARAEE